MGAKAYFKIYNLISRETLNQFEFFWSRWKSILLSSERIFLLNRSIRRLQVFVIFWQKLKGVSWQILSHYKINSILVKTALRYLHTKILVTQIMLGRKTNHIAMITTKLKMLWFWHLSKDSADSFVAEIELSIFFLKKIWHLLTRKRCYEFVFNVKKLLQLRRDNMQCNINKEVFSRLAKRLRETGHVQPIQSKRYY